MSNASSHLLDPSVATPLAELARAVPGRPVALLSLEDRCYFDLGDRESRIHSGLLCVDVEHAEKVLGSNWGQDPAKSVSDRVGALAVLLVEMLDARRELFASLGAGATQSFSCLGTVDWKGKDGFPIYEAAVVVEHGMDGSFDLGRVEQAALLTDSIGAGLAAALAPLAIWRLEGEEGFPSGSMSAMAQAMRALQERQDLSAEVVAAVDGGGAGSRL